MLIFCGRSVYRQGVILLIGRSRNGCFTRRCPHGRKSASHSRVWKRRGRTQREKHGERQNEDTSNRQSTAHHGWHEDGMSARMQTLEPWLVLSHAMWLHINCEGWTAWDLSAHTVGYSGSPSTLNETNCNKRSRKNPYELISNSCSTTMCLKKDATSSIVL